MYKLQNQSIKRLSDGASIPFANGNRDYEEYKQWLADGGIPEPEFTDIEILANAKEAKRNQIRQEFEVSSNSPVVVNTVSYSGGFDSAIKLDAVKRLSEAAGATSVTMYDIYNIGHVLTLADAQNVVIQIAGKYQMDFATKQSRMVVVENALTVAEVEAV